MQTVGYDVQCGKMQKNGFKNCKNLDFVVQKVELEVIFRFQKIEKKNHNMYLDPKKINNFKKRDWNHVK